MRTEKKLDAAMRMMEGERIRWLMGKRPTLTMKGNVFNEIVTETRFDIVLYNAAIVEIDRNMILEELETGPKTVHQLSELTGIPKHDVVKHLIALKKWGKVDYAGRDGKSPLYRSNAVQIEEVE
ncbi:MAG: transcriptional regulator [Methanomassiliicoccales archaeon]|nr:transcriptional regulator [Methanomassiliicoccales archaeon]